MRGSTGQMSADQAKLAAEDFLSYGNVLANTVQKLRLQGCQETQLDFSNTNWIKHDGTIFYIPSSFPNAISGCGVFKNGEGGAQAAVMPLNYMYNWTTIAASNTEIGSGRIMRYVIPGVGSSNEDVVLLYPTVSLAVCQKINEQVGIANPTNDVPTMTLNFTTTDYFGTFSGGGTMTDTSAGSVLTGKTTFCARSSANPQDNRFMQVLMAR